MYHRSNLEKLSRRWKAIFVVSAFFAVIVGLITLLLPLEYRSDAQVFIISKSGQGADPYNIIRSAERINENIVQVMKTNDFYEKVMAQEDFKINKTRFEKGSERDKRKKWDRSVRGSVVYGTGVLNISAFSTDSEEAKSLAGAVATALTRHGWEYVGGDIDIKIVNDPIVTKYPVRPNILVNLLLGFIVGLLLMSIFVLNKR